MARTLDRSPNSIRYTTGVTNHQHNLVRALRVAWTAAFGLLSLFLIILWLRSYSHRDQSRGCIFGSRHHILVTSLRGQIAVGYDEWRGPPHDWIFESKTEPENLISVYSTATGIPPFSWLGIRGHLRPNLWILVIPNWILLCASFGFALLPWTGIEHKVKRFSLRTLLFTTTLLAFALGFLIYCLK